MSDCMLSNFRYLRELTLILLQWCHRVAVAGQASRVVIVYLVISFIIVTIYYYYYYSLQFLPVNHKQEVVNFLFSR